MKSYWVRGGLIAIGIYVALGAVIALYEFEIAVHTFMTGVYTLVYFFGLGSRILGTGNGVYVLLYPLVSLVAVFIIGALVGLVYGKFKKLTA